MKTKHTPGPWKQGNYTLWPASGGNAQFPIHAPKRGRIALALNKEADARLIASAPELLAMLERIRDDKTWRTGDNTLWPDLCALIDKATGHAS